MFNTVSSKFSQMFESTELFVSHYLLASFRTVFHGTQFGKITVITTASPKVFINSPREALAVTAMPPIRGNI